MANLRDFLPLPRRGRPPWLRDHGQVNLISEEEFYEHLAEKYGIYFFEGALRLVQPIHDLSTALTIASFNIKAPTTRSSGLAVYIVAKGEAEAIVAAGIVDELVGKYLTQQLAKIEGLLGRKDFEEASRLMSKLSLRLELLATLWMASQAKKLRP